MHSAGLFPRASWIYPSSYALALGPAKVSPEDGGPASVHADPLGELARAAGYDDAERWWDSMVEQRQDSADLFDAILEAMTALRQELPGHDPLEAPREAAMRQAIDQADRDGFRRMAVVCGAWHAPALAGVAYSETDAQCLAAPESIDVGVTWVPWTYSRLARAYGYGAGVTAPAWYDFLWQQADPKRLAVGWLTRVAQHLRTHKLDASTAQVIDAVHLVETLAGMRDRALPDLHDLNEAALSVLCHGNELPMQIIQRDLMFGSAMGHVSDTTPIVPLEQDFNRTVERLGLTLTDEPVDYELDLRLDHDRHISTVLNRLILLEIPWGRYEDYQDTAP